MVVSHGVAAIKIKWRKSRYILEITPVEHDGSSVGEEKGIKDA